ncbi:MAG: GTP pyrophosphokinase family protein [Clostridia bacterium]|jgi:putative GTP pyrophosphokinase|nr:GTP pyrophosphokinase family protein [Clostridia bacterium]
MDDEEIVANYGFYGESLILLEGAITEVITRIDIIRRYIKIKGFRDPIEHVKTRIKSEESMKEKLIRKGLAPTCENAVTKVYDAAGIRVICTFVDDVYRIVELLKSQQDIKIIEEKDYISNPKPSGYRSFHLIIKVPIHLPKGIRYVNAEIQIRTIAMDCWASLEHEMRYKKDVPNTELIAGELKRCADEIASTDLTLQAIRDMIDSEGTGGHK